MSNCSAAALTADVLGSTAVLAAISFWDYAFVAAVPGSDAYKATGRCISVAAGRISYIYNLKGNTLKPLPNASGIPRLPYTENSENSGS